jgi:hypothetical protein
MRWFSGRGSVPRRTAVHPEGISGGLGAGKTTLQPKLAPWKQALYTLINLVVHLRNLFQFW